MNEKERKLNRRRRLKRKGFRERFKLHGLEEKFRELSEREAEGLLPRPPVFLETVVSQVEQLTPELIEHLRYYKEALSEIRWDVAEHLVAEVLASKGYVDVRLVGRDVTTAADIYAAHTYDPLGTTIRFFIEVKHHKEPVGVEVINSVLGAVLLERPAIGWHAGIIVSTGGFRNCRRYPRQTLSMHGLELRDKSDLFNWLEEYEPNGSGLWLPRPARNLPVPVPAKSSQTRALEI
ncbi:MAG: restriction endonuclease [Acidobacteriota bacterium]